MIREEKAVYGQISDEEWEVIRASKKERRSIILGHMRDHLLKTSKCANCTTWRVESGEIWGNRYENKMTFSDEDQSNNIKLETQEKTVKKLLQVGYWKPFNGLQMSDVLFPHISHGFRKKNFQIITYHVRLRHNSNDIIIQSFSILKNPPWQIISHNDSGMAGTTSKGLVIDILNELSKKLNFTFSLHVSGTVSNLNFSDDINSSVRF